MKRIYVILFLSSALFLLGARDNHVFSHGIQYTIDKAETMIVRVEYDDGEPASYSEVKIFSPDDPKVEYQKGRTDKKGQFSFLPDKGGEWKVVITDGMGHAIAAEVLPDNKAGTGLAAVQSSGLTRWQKAAIALSVVWGFIGWAFFLKARNMRRTNP
ncbi:MAG: hypothetical protein AB1847_19960 [bacterium]